MARPGEAQKFYQEGMQQLDHLLLGEQEAKLGVLTAMVMGENVLLVGPPGGGKTTLGTDTYRLIEGISSEDVSEIPPLADLSPTQLVGSSATTSKDITANGEARTETTTTALSPILRENTKVIFANEINRMNPFGLNAAMEALESGKVITTAGTTYLKDLEYVVSTMNPSESRQAVFPMTAAMASRHSLGAVMGNTANQKMREHIIRKVAQGYRPDPTQVSPVIDLSGLKELREDITSVPIPESVLDETVGLVTWTVGALEKATTPIHEADGRITKQITEIAKTLAMFEAEERVETKHVAMAIRFVLGARLGALSVSAASDVDRLSDELNSQVSQQS